MPVSLKVFITSVLVFLVLLSVATWTQLAIGRPAAVKGLAEAHGGHVEVESEEGRGSRFLVRLPRDVAPPVGAASAGGER
jgi:hypothetical protein